MPWWATTDYEKWEWRQMIAQWRLASSGGKVPCHECCAPQWLSELFRCYYCLFWFCRRCGSDHFRTDGPPPQGDLAE